MAKKKSIKQSQPKTFWQKARSLEWYVKLLIVIIIGVIGFQIFKVSVNKHNIALLDEAEAKMRALEVPESLETRYERSCALKSVKFQSSGRPLCGVHRFDILTSDNLEDANNKIQAFLDTSSVRGQNYDKNKLKDRIEDFGYSSVEILPLADNLSCSYYFTYDYPGYQWNRLGLSDEKKYLNITTGCTKRVIFQIYPESY